LGIFILIASKKFVDEKDLQVLNKLVKEFNETTSLGSKIKLDNYTKDLAYKYHFSRVNTQINLETGELQKQGNH
jgi:hypothetical protein